MPSAMAQRHHRSRRVAVEIDQIADSESIQWRDFPSSPIYHCPWFEAAMAASVTTCLVWQLNTSLMEVKLVIVSIVVALHCFLLA